MASRTAASSSLGTTDGHVGGEGAALSRKRALGGRLAGAAEVFVRRLEASGTLDRVGKGMGGAVAKVVRPGPVKDLLSGTWLGHTAHPVLTDLPIGSFTSAVVLDLLGGEKAAGGARALVGIGVLSALPTAATGLSELADLGEARDRAVAAAHALGNTAALGLFAASYLARKGDRRAPGILLALAGSAVMTLSAFLGGHLSFRRGIGVDHTAFESPIAEWTGVLDEAELPEGQARRVTAEGVDVFLYRTPSRIFALADRCSHAGGPLHEGSLEEQGTVICPWHGSCFDLADGSVVRGPATAPQPVYQARVRDGKIQIRSRP